MIGLFLNTAFNYFQAFIFKDIDILDEVFVEVNHEMSSSCLKIISDMLSRCNLTILDVDKIYCVRGPGSFTGLRIGATIAKVCSWGLEKELYSLSSLQCMACSDVATNYVIPIVNARRGYVFAGIYDSNRNVYMTDRYMELQELKDIVSKLNGSYSYVSLDEFDFEVMKFVPNNKNILRYCSFRKESPYDFVPDYLKEEYVGNNG